MENKFDIFDNALIDEIQKIIDLDCALEIQKRDGEIVDIAPKRVIYKYNIEKSNLVTANIEQVLDVQIQNDVMVAWVLINPLYPEITVKFDLIGTGWPYADRRSDYLKTIQDGELVWHVFMRKNPVAED